MSEPFHEVLPLAELAPGSMRAVTVAGREVVLCHTKEGISALDDLCTHAYARMSEGRLRGTRLICPLHGASFDARSGQVLAPPATAPLCRHAVRVAQGMIAVALDPAAPPQALV